MRLLALPLLLGLLGPVQAQEPSTADRLSWSEVHDWAHRHFPDPEHGEWFGYLHRDGRRSVTLKGNLWKGPFHLPRMQLLGWQTLEGMRPDPGPSRT